MLSYEGFTLIIMLFILAPIMGAIALYFYSYSRKGSTFLKIETKRYAWSKHCKKHNIIN